MSEIIHQLHRNKSLSKRNKGKEKTPSKPFIPSSGSECHEHNNTANKSTAARHATFLNAALASKILSLSKVGDGDIFGHVSKVHFKDLEDHLTVVKKFRKHKFN